MMYEWISLSLFQSLTQTKPYMYLSLTSTNKLSLSLSLPPYLLIILLSQKQDVCVNT